MLGTPFFVKYLEKISPQLAGKMAFKLFCRAHPTPLRVIESKIMNEAQQDFIQVNGQKVITYQWGAGKPVLLLHGWESRASRFYLFAKELSKNGYQVISYDAPGHGASEGKSTTILENYQIIKELENRYGAFETIIAHSLGVLNGFYAVKEGISTKGIIALSGVTDFYYLVEKYSNFLGITHKTQQFFKTSIEEFFLPRTDIWASFSAHKDPEKVKAQVLIIHDNEDTDVSLTQSELLYNAHPDKAKMHITKGLGHLRILHNIEIIHLALNHIKGCTSTNLNFL